MQVQIARDFKFSKADHLFLLLPESDRKAKRALPSAFQGAIQVAITKSGFTGRCDESLTLFGESTPAKITLIGLGKQEAISLRSIRAAIYAVGKVTRRNRDKAIAVFLPHLLDGYDSSDEARLYGELLAQADYRFNQFLTRSDDQEGPREIRCNLLVGNEIDARKAKSLTEEIRIVSGAVKMARDLGNGPGNQVTPPFLAETAQAVAREHGLKCTVFDKKQIEKLKMGGLLAVNRGSDIEPRFVILEHAPAKAGKAGKTICLVGKGITFDSGGISIKPAEKMEEMKFDMCGAAAVIGIMQAAAQLKFPHRIIGIFASTENLPSGSAYKPGDIITTMSGKTVEVVNTDAEGRMILADALHYAARYKPDHLIDFATLTGACVVALGYEASGLFSNDDKLAQKLIESGQRAGEKLWRLPEWDDYKDYIRSDWADMKNSGGRWGGAITAALFLKEYVNCSWAHLDIAGTAWAEGENAREAKGATGVGVRLTLDYLRSI